MNSNQTTLRERLAARLARMIRNPSVEAKELAAFDLIMSRRQFMQAAELSAIGALVNSPLVPTAWGQCAEDCASVTPETVGLTAQDLDAVTQATGVTYGTELFQDTIYSQPVVAPTQPYMHGLIEGARSRMRVQSQIADGSPLEETFLDRNFHFGPAELVQLEEDKDGKWELVHYFHTWAARSDGGRADGLTRHVIMTASDGLANPTKILCITASHTNEFSMGSKGLQVAAAYAIYVEQDSGLADGFVVMGHALSQVEGGEVTGAADYPITWTWQNTSNLNLPPGTNRYLFADKYVNAGLDTDGNYAPTLATEHVVMYLTNVMKIISLDDATTPGKPNLIVTSVPYPPGVTEARFAHIEFNPVAPGNGAPPLQLDDFAVVSVTAYNPNVVVFLYTCQSTNAVIDGGDYKDFGGGLKWLRVDYSTYSDDSGTVPLPTKIDRPDYTTLQNVHGLATIAVEVEGRAQKIYLNLSFA